MKKTRTNAQSTSLIVDFSLMLEFLIVDSSLMLEFDCGFQAVVRFKLRNGKTRGKKKKDQNKRTQ